MGQKAAQRGGWVDGREPLGGGLDWERRVRPKSSMGGVDLLGQGGVFGWGGEGVGDEAMMSFAMPHFLKTIK